MREYNKTIASACMGAQTKSMCTHIRLYIIDVQYTLRFTCTHTHAWMHRYWFAIVLPHHVSKPIEIQHISKFGYPSRYGVFPDSFCNSGFWSERPSYAQSVVWYWYHALWFCRNHVQFTLCSFACLFCGAYVFVVITTTQESHSVDTSHVVQLPRFLPAWHLQHSWKGLPTMPHGPIFFVFWANGVRWMLAGHFQWPEWVSHLWMSGLARLWSISLPSMSGVIVLGSIEQDKQRWTSPFSIVRHVLLGASSIFAEAQHWLTVKNAQQAPMVGSKGWMSAKRALLDL